MALVIIELWIIFLDTKEHSAEQGEGDNKREHQCFKNRNDSLGFMSN
jgi:hypothetical protein